MLSLNIPAYSDPSGYILSDLPKPEITDSKDVVIKVHAASVNPVDVKKADGILKMALKDTASRFKVGDEVYVRLPESHRGAWSEYAGCPEEFIALKPPSLSFESAAAIPLAATTAFQALQKYNGDLTGKTVFVPAGLGGVGLYALQLAKHVFHAGNVITTVSTSKIPKVEELLGKGTVDQIIDYRKSDPKDVIPHGSVDFLFDTMAVSMEYLCLMRPKTSRIVSISTLPSGTLLQNSSVMRLPDRPTLPFAYKAVLNVLDATRRLRARRYGVEYSYMFLEPSGNDLDTLRGYIEEGKLKTVVGTTANLRDIEEVRKACQVVYGGQGGLGKVVIRVAESDS
ncbi:chaperonin 10-like protein [Aspergillus leporis]|uniref:Chaperonin 10-like protein n=1 Tax=Aspergillus leporis TaxID=41062 RepID=A0A5N5X934_9EURO|nr:chaperonin 10-like protein [Aspergillus leporis]